MHLHQEYANRFGIDYQFIKHENYSLVFFKDDKECYTKLTISRIKNNNYPNKYRIQYESPTNRLELLDVEWDEYETYLENFCKNINKSTNVIDDKDDVQIASWEMFLIRNDKHISNNIGPDLVYPTIDLSLSKERRISQIKKISLDYDFKNYNSEVEKYSYWLAKFIKNLNK